PSGEAWWDWLLAGLGIVVAVAGAVATGGALVGAVGAAGGMVAALSTSSGATAAVAAVLDVVAVAAEIGSTASMAGGNKKAGAIFGWIGLGVGIASVGAGGAPWRLGKKASGAMTARKIDAPLGQAFSSSKTDAVLPPTVVGRVILPKEAVPQHARLRHFPNGMSSKRPSWDAVFDEKRYPGTVHYAADGPVAPSDIPWILTNVIDAHPDSDITLLVGAHGRWDGQNWLLSGRRKVDRDLLPDSIRIIGAQAGQAAAGRMADGRKVRFVDVAELTPDAARTLYAEPVIFIHMSCYGIVDEVLLAMFGRVPKPVYVTWPTQ
ncbi:hypothetical protein, partial [Luteibacter yeojuensis]